MATPTKQCFCWDTKAGRMFDCRVCGVRYLVPHDSPDQETCCPPVEWVLLEYKNPQVIHSACYLYDNGDKAALERQCWKAAVSSTDKLFFKKEKMRVVFNFLTRHVYVLFSRDNRPYSIRSYHADAHGEYVRAFLNEPGVLGWLVDLLDDKLPAWAKISMEDCMILHKNRPPRLDPRVAIDVCLALVRHPALITVKQVMGLKAFQQACNAYWILPSRYERRVTGTRLKDIIDEIAGWPVPKEIHPHIKEDLHVLYGSRWVPEQIKLWTPVYYARLLEAGFPIHTLDEVNMDVHRYFVERSGTLGAAVKNFIRIFTDPGGRVGHAHHRIYTVRDTLNMANLLEVNVNLARMSYEEIERLHERLRAVYRAQSDEIEARKFRRLVEGFASYEADLDGYRIVAPHEPQEIVEEGEAMDHCVGSYVHDVIRGEVIILFLRQSGERVATIAFDPRTQILEQCLGPHNLTVRGEAKEVVQAWARKHKIDAPDRAFLGREPEELGL